MRKSMLGNIPNMAEMCPLRQLVPALLAISCRDFHPEYLSYTKKFWNPTFPETFSFLDAVYSRGMHFSKRLLNMGDHYEYSSSYVSIKKSSKLF